MANEFTISQPPKATYEVDAQLANTSDVKINPATSDNQDSIIDAVEIPVNFEGAPVTVGTTAVELTFSGKTKSIKVSSAKANTGTIYVGKSDVTNLGANAMDEIVPSQSLMIDFDDTSNAIYVVSSVAGQTVYKMALL